MGNLNITAVDVVVAVVLLGSAGFAFMRGFVHEVLSISSWAGAALITLYGFARAQPFFRDKISPSWAADAACGAALFLVTLLVLSIITKMVSDRVRKSALNSVDSSLGFVFGLARGALLACLAYLSVAWLFGTTEQQPDWLSQARTRPWLQRGAEMLQEMAPAGLGTAEAKAREAGGEARQLMDAEKTFQKFLSPKPAQPPAPQEIPRSFAKPSDKAAYDSESQSQMDRLIRSNQ